MTQQILIRLHQQTEDCYPNFHIVILKPIQNVIYHPHYVLRFSHREKGITKLQDCCPPPFPSLPLLPPPLPLLHLLPLILFSSSPPPPPSPPPVPHPVPLPLLILFSSSSSSSSSSYSSPPPHFFLICIVI